MMKPRRRSGHEVPGRELGCQQCAQQRARDEHRQPPPAVLREHHAGPHEQRKQDGLIPGDALQRPSLHWVGQGLFIVELVDPDSARATSSPASVYTVYAIGSVRATPRSAGTAIKSSANGIRFCQPVSTPRPGSVPNKVR